MLVAVYVYIHAALWAQSPVPLLAGQIAASGLVLLLLLRFSMPAKGRARWVEQVVVFLVCGLLELAPSFTNMPILTALQNALLASTGVLIFTWFVYRWKSGDHVSTAGMAAAIVLATFALVAPVGLIPLAEDRLFLLRWLVIWYGVQYTISYYGMKASAYTVVAFLSLASIALKSLS